MFSEDNIRYIAEMFIGDVESLYPYKSGPKIVAFFNKYFDYDDEYGQGFPSRWLYTYNKLVELITPNLIDKLFNIILHKRYLMIELGINEVSAIETSKQIVDRINSKIIADGYTLTKKGDYVKLVKEDEDLIYIGGGGFAEVYKRMSNGIIVKKLKEDFVLDSNICSRFKREYDITKTLNEDGIDGVIRVFDFFEENYSYTMEEAEQTLSTYITGYDLPDTTKVSIIRQIMHVMKIVHEKDIIHRDISPTNVLILSGLIKISDFGLGKDLNIFHSHQTIYTNALGQYFYCAPEQFMLLKEGDKRSDVYSLGRIINFIMTENPNDYNHYLRAVTEKATSNNSVFRYSDANDLLKAIERSIEYHQSEIYKEEIIEKAKSGVLNEAVENYIYELSGKSLCEEIIGNSIFKNTILKFMNISEEKAIHIIGLIEDNFRYVCKSTWESYDPFAQLSYEIIMGEFSFLIKEIALRILKDIAFNANRYSAQRLIDKIKEKGIEPLLEDML